MKKNILFLMLIVVNYAFTQITLAPFSPTLNQFNFGNEIDAFNNQIVCTASNSFEMTMGKLFIFEKTGSGLVQTNSFQPLDGIPSDSYGKSISINNDFIAIGSPFNDQLATNSGAIYLYRKTNGVWAFFQKIIAFDGLAEDYFGFKVKIYNNQLFVVATGDEPTGQNSSDNNGSVYVYNFDGTTWNFSQKLAIATTNQLGKLIDIENDKLLVSGGTISNSNTTIYTFLKNGNNWTFNTNLNPSSVNPVEIKSFSLNNGILFLISRDQNLIQSIKNYTFNTTNWSFNSSINLPSTISDSRMTNIKVKNDVMLIGATEYTLQVSRKSPIFYFKKVNSNWVLQQTLYGNGNAGSDDYFGNSIAISDNLVAIGAPSESSSLPYGKAYTFDTNLSISSNEKLLNAIYPNPTNDVIYFNDELFNEVKTVELYQLDGKLIQQLNTSNKSISLKSFQSGIYVLKLTFSDQSFITKKIIKQ